jgi:predicted CXXCH cytochrome family protein
VGFAGFLFFLSITSTPSAWAQPPRPLTPEELKLVDVSGGCVTAECHGTMGKKAFQHGPMLYGQCEPCHVAIEKRHVFQEPPQKKDLCLKCHDIERRKAVVHKPFDGDCKTCHNPHESDQRYFVKGGTGSAGCLLSGCHQDFPRNMKFQHTSLEEGGCLVCHTSHQSDNEKLLTIPKDALCFACHSDIPGQMAAAIDIHDPVKQKNCTGCHSPHGGETKNLVPADEKAFCKKCHAGVFDRLSNLSFPHGAIMTDASCANCHEPHMSSYSRLLAGPVEDLCLKCHNKPLEATKGRMLSNIAKQMAEMRYPHGPVTLKNCVACHRAHGSDFQSLLNKNLSDKFYASSEEGANVFCFDCHDERLVNEKQTSRTGFRNGEKNLHAVHVLGSKGRTCRACHHEHGTGQPRLIRTSVKYGQWDMPLKFALSAGGGNCQTPCHSAYRYDRARPYENKKGVNTEVRSDSEVSKSVESVSISLKAGQTAPGLLLSDVKGAGFDLSGNTSPTLLLFLKPTDVFLTRSVDNINQIFVQDPELKKGLRLWVVLPALTPNPSVELTQSRAGADWTVLLDREGKGFPAYHAIATPKAVLVDTDKRVKLVIPGYDIEMANTIRKTLGAMTGLPEVQPAPPHLSEAQLTLQLAKRLRARGLWESAWMYYEEARKTLEFPLEVEVERAEVLLEMKRPDDAIAILRAIQVTPQVEGRVVSLLKRAAEIKSGMRGAAKPPAVTR